MKGRGAAALLVAVMAVSLPVVARSTPGRAAGASPRSIQVLLSTTGDRSMFDQRRMVLPFAKTVRVRYKNDASLGSGITHNVAIIRSERVAAVMAVLKDHDYDLASLRGSADILALTRVLDPGQEDAVDFSPPGPGEYVYICLLPAHREAPGMLGILTIGR